MIIQKLAAKMLGIRISEEQEKEIVKKIPPLLTLLGCNSVETFAKQLETAASGGFDQFVGLVTNNETYFFREPNHFAFIGENVIAPHLIAPSENHRLRFMSLGCANGAEPYSIAMAVYDFLKQYPNLSCEIRALDVNPFNIQTAKQATYHPYSFRQPLLDAQYQQRFFTSVGNHWLLNPEIRAMVKFEECNFAQEPFGKGWEGNTDVIFFRNVVMYFDDETRMRVFRRVADLLHNKGYFIVASQEVYSVPSTLFTAVHTKSGFVFLKSCAKSFSAKQIVSTKKGLKQSTVTSAGRSPSILAKTKITQAIEHFDREEFTSARTLLDEISKLEKNNPYFWLLKANLALNTNEDVIAWEAALQAIQMDSLLPEGYFVLGLVHKSRGAIKEAEELLRKALFLVPDFWPARVFLGELLRKRGQREAALVQYKSAVGAIGPKSPSPLYLERWSSTVEGIARQGIDLLMQGRTDRAES